ncbi:ABC transporter permease [Caballeronia glebae]|uniref:Capsular polysaccharide export ABC transporter transmembrane protein n=1 Tax=Caballeronia glebae TaxID=1777143 RepID=A0A158DFQ1_9BURK|nr:sugar ABC transporter permease [Caballeronia glebae]SAK93240.1 capsular polysaccharide export ABC transporter transmembrane protein [Caballeronia glebae]
MSNDERIKKWRARRQSGDYSIGAGSAEYVRATASQERAARDACNVDGLLQVLLAAQPASSPLRCVLDALRASANESIVERRSVYEALQCKLQLQTSRAALSQEEADFCSRRLRTIIRLVEMDLRAGLDVYAASYRPERLATDDARLTSAFDKRAQRRREQEKQDARRLALQSDLPLLPQLVPQEAADLSILRARVDLLHAKQNTRTLHGERSRLSALLPLLALQLHTMHAESRFALIWALLGPSVLLTLISSLYFLTGTHFVLGMDVPTFSMTGATTWIMFRQIIFRSSTGYVSARGLLNLPGVTPLMCALVQAAMFLCIYLFVFGLLITVGHSFNLVSLPVHWPAFVLCVVAMAIGGASMGVAFGAAATRWHFILRLAPVIERFLEIFSSVFFVSEQLPAQYRPYFLWSPLAHGMQLLRSAYFGSYRSTDASLSYFLTTLVFMVVIALVAERFARSRVQPM